MSSTETTAPLTALPGRLGTLPWPMPTCLPPAANLSSAMRMRATRRSSAAERPSVPDVAENTPGVFPGVLRVVGLGASLERCLQHNPPCARIACPLRLHRKPRPRNDYPYRRCAASP